MPPAPSAGCPQQERFALLDIVRGVAVLGILLLNIIGFAMPEAAYFNPRAYGGWHGADLVAWLVNFVFFDGRMRGLFSFLFGASLLLIAERAEAQGESAARLHYRRMVWLLLFGLAHLYLVWSGDILAHYALVGMVAFAMRGLPVTRLLVLGTMLWVLAVIDFAAIPLEVLRLQGEHGSATTALAGYAEVFGVPEPTAIARDLATYRGSYATILQARIAEHLADPLQLLLVFGPETLAYMLFGMAALRSGLLRGTWSRARLVRGVWIGWGLALPAAAAVAVWLIHSRFAIAAVAMAAFPIAALVRPPMILGWICLIALAARPGGAITDRIGAAGRMAFTNYLATSLICTSLFYGYGFAWFGDFSRWQLYPIVAAIWVAILLWSKPWLARFRYGPLEWLWRSLVRGHPVPMRLRKYANSSH